MDLLLHTLRAISGAIVTPPLVFLLICLIVMLHLKNKKLVAMQKIILGGSVNSVIELTLSQLVFGILGGCAASIILNSIGIIFNENSGISYLFIISILLAFIKPRLICFSYSGAILGFVSIVLKVLNTFMPQNPQFINLDMDIFSLIVLIAVFHIIEGILVIIDGDRGAVPIFTNKDGKILGGYLLKRYWALPIAIIMIVSMNSSTLGYSGEVIQDFNWWSLMGTSITTNILSTGIVSIMPFYTILGYSSVTFTRSKKQKAISSGMHILIYGIILMCIAQIAKIGIGGEVLVLAFMPSAHEFMLRIQVRNESKRNPKFVSDEEGLVILEISTDSKIKEFGIGIESKIVSVNDKSINSEKEMYSIIKDNLYNAVLKVKDSHGITKEIKFRQNKNTRFGILLVPRNINRAEIISVEENNFKNILKTIKKSNHPEKNDDDNNKLL